MKRLLLGLVAFGCIGSLQAFEIKSKQLGMSSAQACPVQAKKGPPTESFWPKGLPNPPEEVAGMTKCFDRTKSFAGEQGDFLIELVFFEDKLIQVFMFGMQTTTGCYSMLAAIETAYGKSHAGGRDGIAEFTWENDRARLAYTMTPGRLPCRPSVLVNDTSQNLRMFTVKGALEEAQRKAKATDVLK